MAFWAFWQPSSNKQTCYFYYFMYCYICIVCGKQILLFLFVVGCVNDRLQHISNYVNNACLMLVTLKLTEACVYHLSVRVSGFPLKSQNENSGLFQDLICQTINIYVYTVLVLKL